MACLPLWAGMVPARTSHPSARWTPDLTQPDENELRTAAPRSSRWPHSACNAKRAALNADRSALNADRSALNDDRSALNAHRSALNGDRSALLGDRSALNGDRFALNGDRFALNDERFALNGMAVALGGHCPGAAPSTAIDLGCMKVRGIDFTGCAGPSRKHTRLHQVKSASYTRAARDRVPSHAGTRSNAPNSFIQKKQKQNFRPINYTNIQSASLQKI